jgi:hypothetical protein
VDEEPAEEVAGRAIDGKGTGEPLEPATRRTLESRIGADLGDVRVHKDPGARAAASALGGRAFTHGRDIWLGPGESDENVHLMAHEAAHVVQQGATVQRQVVQRAKAKGGASEASEPAETADVDPKTLPRETGQLDGETISFAEIEVPGFKLDKHRGALYGGRSLKQKKNYERKSPDQRSVWKEKVGAGLPEKLKTTLEEKLAKAHAPSPVDPAQRHVFKAPSKFKGDRYFTGDVPTVARELSLPSWGTDGQGRSYDVDHIVELQLANWDDDGWANTLENMELLDSSTNSSSGSIIKGNIEKKVSQFVKVTGGKYGKSSGAVKKRYSLAFDKAVPGKAGAPSIPPDYFWTRKQIEDGEPLDTLKVASAAELGGTDEVKLFPDPAGGIPKRFKWPGPALDADERKWLKPYEITAKQFNTAEGSESSAELGRLTFNVPADHETWKRLEADHEVVVQRLPGARFAGYIDKKTVRADLAELRHKQMSPVQIDEFDLLPDGVYVTGTLLPDVPLLQGTGIDLEIHGNAVTLSKEFSVGDFKVPRPLEVTDCTLTISASTETGLGIKGRVEFAIEKVGQGYLQAGATTAGGFSLEGGFNFDSTLFDPAMIEFWYRDNQFGARGILGITPGTVRGIRSASVTATYDKGRLDAIGTVKPDVPGIEQGDMAVTYTEAEGLVIAGTLTLKKDIPGIRSGSVNATVRRKPGEEEYAVSALGTAEPAIPGVSATLTVAYEDGALTIEGTAGYEKGLVKGTLTLGATNRPVGEDGKPSGEPTGKFTAYGGGAVTVRITPWLQGTVGVRLLPNGEVELSGAIGLPATVEIFPEKKVQKNIFTIGIDIPIIGVAVAGQRIGIFATISGGLEASAGFGPGQLRELGLSITYNPAHEDQTHVSGGAQLHIPAHAGLRLFVRGALGAGIPIVSASAGLEVGGALGLEGAVDAGVQVDWMPSRGLVLDAAGEISVEPKFTFDISGFVLVEANLLLTTITLYEQKWQLAAFEYGSGLRFGIKFPIHYEEGKPFDVSLSDVEFEIPDIDPEELLGGLVKQIA